MMVIRSIKFYEGKPGKRGRAYAVDDEDFMLYKQRGGKMSLAEFFNHHLQDDQGVNLEARLCDSLGAKPEPQGNLESRIRLTLSG